MRCAWARNRNTPLLCGLVLLWTASPASGAQTQTVLEYSPCSSCAIKVTADVVLEDAAYAEDIRRMADGRILFVSNYDATGFRVYAGDGVLVRRVGRSGEGPGEYRYIRWTIPWGDRIHVFDAARRLTVLDAAFDVVRTRQLPGSPHWDAAMLDDSTYVVNMVVPTRDRIGYALHVMDGQGEVLRSFDELRYGYGSPGSEVDMSRNLWVSQDGTILAAHYSRYRIDQWDPATGQQVRSLVRDADWFPDHLRSPRADPDEPALPTISSVAEDDRGRLWVAITVASQDWADKLVETPDDAHPELGDYSFPDDRDAIYDTVLEVIDPVAGKVIATATFDMALRLVDAERATSVVNTSSLAPSRQMWRLDLKLPGEPSGGK